MTDRRHASGRQGRPSEETNPFAPPPEGQPDRPWQSRHPEGGRPGGGSQDPQDSPDSPVGEGGEGEQDDQRTRWGSQWSRRQPKRQNGGFGEPPEERGDRERRRGGPGQRWDPADPAQRHARAAFLSGMWGVFFGLLGWNWLALLLGALALYWGISALRGGPKTSGDGEQQRDTGRVEELEGASGTRRKSNSGGRGNGSARPQFPAALAGVALAVSALLIVASTYTVQLIYKEYYDCMEDALTAPARESCEQHLPSQLRPLLGERDG